MARGVTATTGDISNRLTTGWNVDLSAGYAFNRTLELECHFAINDSLAMHLKLSELIAAVRGSTDRMMVVEKLAGAELRQLHAHYLELVQARKTDETTTS